MSDTATSSEAPWVKASTASFSFRPEMKIMMMAMVRKEAAICGNHQPAMETPHTISGKARMNRVRMILRRRVKGTPSSRAPPFRKRARKLSRSS
ncbi:hypothetical protein D3C71_1879670 [compost metagenome]